MLNLSQAKNIVIVGGGTAGWFAALTMRRIFSPQVTVRLIESSDVGIVGVGEGGLLNIVWALQANDIDIQEFMKETGSTYKWGFCYEGWRTGESDDKFYHLFGSNAHQVNKNIRGFYPYFSAMINKNIPLHSYMRGFQAIKTNATQNGAKAMVNSNRTDIISSLHFDSYKIAKYLKKIALSRGVVHIDEKINDVIKDKNNHFTKIITKKEEYDADFIIDASGLSRLIIGKLDSKWESFSKYLLMDSAIPFYMPHPYKNPALYTRAIAMKAGWMWQIPLVERVGAGYVYSSKHITREDAISEVEEYLGYKIEPQKTISFDPGCHKKVWTNNVVALGLSSGFVEPLEATSIGQMIEQLRNIERIFLSTQGIISDKIIDEFNEANYASWMGIRDFLRMHYDCARKDNAFWKEATNAPMPKSYAQTKECWQRRTPRDIDNMGYVKNGWGGIFHTINWMYVGVPLGVIPAEATVNELLSLPKEEQQKIADSLDTLA